MKDLDDKEKALIEEEKVTEKDSLKALEKASDDLIASINDYLDRKTEPPKANGLFEEEHEQLVESFDEMMGEMALFVSATTKEFKLLDLMEKQKAKDSADDGENDPDA